MRRRRHLAVSLLLSCVLAACQQSDPRPDATQSVDSGVQGQETDATLARDSAVEAEGSSGAPVPDTRSIDAAPDGPPDVATAGPTDADAGAPPDSAAADSTDADTSRPPDSGAADRGARLVAIGDLHGDLAATRRALRLAGAIDESDHWIGGDDLKIVQVGDLLDRGDDEPEIMQLFEDLRGEAEAAGAAVVVLHGNHELMNVEWDFRYVTPEGMTDFDEYAAIAGEEITTAFAPEEWGRAAAFESGGPVALDLARNDVVHISHDTVFVHGGVTASHVAYGVEKMNEEVRAWLRAERDEPAFVYADESPVWVRIYGDDVAESDCAALGEVLQSLGAERMVIGHTVQPDGITSACDGKVWRVDTGLASYYGGPTQVLQIVGNEVTVLR